MSREQSANLPRTILLLLFITVLALLVLQYVTGRRLGEAQQELSSQVGELAEQQDRLSSDIGRLRFLADRNERYRALRTIRPEDRPLLYPALRTFDTSGISRLGEFRRQLREDIMDWSGFDRRLPGLPVRVNGLEEETVDSLDVVRRRVEFGFEGEESWTLRGYLLYPAGTESERLPGVVCLNGHAGSARAVSGIESDYTNSYGLALAAEGCRVLTFDWAFEGESELEAGGRGFHSHDSVFVWMERTGRKGLALYMENALCALRVLEHDRAVDPERIAVTGISRGGELTTYFAALFASRLASYYASGAGFPFVYRRFGGGCKCTYVEPIFRNYEFSDLMAAAAPLPCRLQLGTRDNILGYWDNIRPLKATVGRLYSALGAEEKFGVDIHPDEHVYNVEQAVRFFREFLIGNL